MQRIEFHTVSTIINLGRAAALFAAIAIAPVLPAAQFTVTSTADAGPGTLRQAIDDANAAPGSDVISFAIPEGDCTPGGICEIAVASDLPDVTDGVVIDGTTQPRYGSAPENVCATSSAPLAPRVQVTGDVGMLLHVTSPERVTVRGLALADADSLIRVDAGGLASIQCNLFGISADGATRYGFGAAVCVSCSGGAAQPSIIGTDGDGTDDEREGNVFAAGATGVNINYSDDHVIAGNLFGLRPDGVTRDDVTQGIYIRQSATNNRIGSNLDGISDALERNVFAHGDRGILIASRADSGDANLVIGNWFGVDATGEPGTLDTGVWLQHEGQNHVVKNNRIEAAGIGILIEEAATLSTDSTDNCVLGNDVGLQHSGSATGLPAALNWWGESNGPSGLGGGSGDAIEVTGSGSVDFQPWLTAPGAGCTTTEGVYHVMIPAAAFAEGAGGSFFVTDLEVHNRGGAPAEVVLKWLPRDSDNTTPQESAPFTIAPGATRRFDNVLVRAFGLEQGAGAILIESGSDRLSAMSRTFNRGDGGTFGQSLPGVPGKKMIASGTRVRVLFMTENDDFRSNLGLVNGTGRPITIHVERFDADGNSLGTDARSLPAWGNTQINRIFGSANPIEGAYVDVWTTTPDGAFTCYGSVLDNQTSDPTSIFAD
jgi:hypothetical protein